MSTQSRREHKTIAVMLQEAMIRRRLMNDIRNAPSVEIENEIRDDLVDLEYDMRDQIMDLTPHNHLPI